MHHLLKQRYPAPAWALFFEVADGTGLRRGRSADALAMSVWPSRGLELIGHELKSSRSDWLRELKNPAKAESICRYCDRWWIVAASDDVVRAGELPPAWGLLVAGGGKLKPAVPAPQLSPVAIDKTFLAAVLRCAAAPADRASREAEAAAYHRGVKDEAARAEKALAAANYKADAARADIRAFEQAAGIRLSDWRRTPEHVGRVVREVLDGQHDRDKDALIFMRRTVGELLGRLDAAIESATTTTKNNTRRAQTQRD